MSFFFNIIVITISIFQLARSIALQPLVHHRLYPSPLTESFMAQTENSSSLNGWNIRCNETAYGDELNLRSCTQAFNSMSQDGILRKSFSERPYLFTSDYRLPKMWVSGTLFSFEEQRWLRCPLGDFVIIFMWREGEM